MQRHEDQPLTILGINTDRNRSEYDRKAKEHGINWLDLLDGSMGPISTAWGIQSYPTIFVLDAEGVLRHVNLRGGALDAAVAALLEEL